MGLELIITFVIPLKLSVIPKQLQHQKIIIIIKKYRISSEYLDTNTCSKTFDLAVGIPKTRWVNGKQ